MKPVGAPPARARRPLPLHTLLRRCPVFGATVAEAEAELKAGFYRKATIWIERGHSRQTTDLALALARAALTGRTEVLLLTTACNDAIATILNTDLHAFPFIGIGRRMYGKLGKLGLSSGGRKLCANGFQGLRSLR